MARSGTTRDLSEIVGHFETLEDPRSTINRRHLLPSVVTISLMAVLAGADGRDTVLKTRRFHLLVSEITKLD